MHLATVRNGSRTQAAVVADDRVDLLEFDDLGSLFSSGWTPGDGAKGGSLGREEVQFVNPVPRPEKIVCVGLNFHGHAEEAGLTPGEFPILFAKYWRSLVGPDDAIKLPPNSDQVDWEAELGIVIGRPSRFVEVGDAREMIGGYTVVNDVSMRDWQLRTSQFLQGKTFEASTPVGPIVVTADELEPESGLEIGCVVNGEEMQRSTTSDMIFSAAEIVAYISQIITLAPGDLIACGTPGGIGALMEPPRYLREGDILRTWVEGIGETSNRCTSAPSSEEMNS
jgi:acylpyruvate hydrolase